MGHRHFFNPSQMFDTDHDQNWNHMHSEQPYVHMARVGSADSGSFFYPAENMSIDGVHFTSPWNLTPMSNGYTSSSLNGELLHYQADASAQSHDPLLHSSAAGTFPTDNYMQHGSSSNYGRQKSNAIEGSFIDLTIDNGRGHHKRKSPAVCDRDISSRSYNAGSSSDFAISSEFLQEKRGVESQQLSSEHRSNNLSVRGEGSMRNVRSRAAFDMETNLARTHLSSTPLFNSYSTSHPIEHSNYVELPGQGDGGLAREWNHISMNSAHGRFAASDASGFSHETNRFLAGSSSNNGSPEMQDFSSARNKVVPLSFHGTPTQSIRGVRSSCSQRSTPAFRASSSTLRLGPVSPSEEGLQLVAENYSSRHPRPLSSIGWSNNDRSGRSRISNERHRLSEDSDFYDHLASEGFMLVQRSALSRSTFDQHREMRLDIDNMSYEELLALGERIGSISTGLSEDSISKSLTETIYCSSDLAHDEENCVICLEQYKNMDDVGALNTCGHDFHVGCIKKWLSMKNVCPICKASALSDDESPGK